MKKFACTCKGRTAVALGLLGLVVITLALQPEGRAQPPVELPVAIPASVVDTGSLMRLFNRPIYTQLKVDMQHYPTTESAWMNIEHRGLQAAEVANLIAIRKITPPLDEWSQLAGNLQQAGIALTSAAKSRDWAATGRAELALVQRCNDCHRLRAPDRAPMLKP